MKFEKVGDAIFQGEFDDHLDQLVAAITYRRRAIGMAKVLTIKTGDVITISKNVKPQLLAGARVRVTARTGTRITGILLDARGQGRRWQQNSPIRLPLSLIGEVRNDA